MPETSVAVRSTEQGLTTPAATSVPSPVSAPSAPITSEQASIVTQTPATPAKTTETEPELLAQLATVKGEAAALKTENAELATRVKDYQTVATQVEELGGIDYIKPCVDAVNIYNELAVIPLAPAGQLTVKHWDT